MCDATANGIGDLVPDDQVIYRACLRKNYLTPDKQGVAELAFEKKGQNHTDGLSFALTPAQAVQPFERNHGVIRITVGAVRGLGRGLEVRFDTQTPGHVLVRNMPCVDRSDEEKQQANVVAAELAVRAEIESSLPYPKSQ